MKALFGEGRHPNADAIEQAARAAGKNYFEIDAASRLGNPYRIHEQANMFHRRSAGAFRDYNTEQGLHADTPVPAEVRAQIRSDIAAKMFIETYGRDPVDARELSGHLARISRQATTAVAGYDLSFSPVKSVSTLWAVAPREVAATIEQAHHDAVKDTLTWLEKNATYTRRGKGGVAQVEVHGLIAAAFTHRDSRAGDPDLHTHVAVSNKVQAKDDGQWLALDGRPFFKNNVAASERYNTRLEALLIERLGVSFADRAGTDPEQATHPRNRRCRRCAAPALVQAARVDRRAPGGAVGPVPDRSRSPTDAERGPRTRAEGQHRHPAAQARTPLLRRSASDVAQRSTRRC